MEGLSEQEHLLVFMQERFLTMQEAAAAFGGEEGIEAESKGVLELRRRPC